jgi:hypothetical protein
MNSEAIIILGMHRSGTSALAAVISMLGVAPGNKLQPAEAEVNPKGFWEHTDIVVLHEQLLETLGSSWHDDRPLPEYVWSSLDLTAFRQKIVAILHRDFGATSKWLIKDPRMCRLLPLWRGIFQELSCKPRFILVVRHPAEVASSLRKRDNLPQELACLLWLVHMLESEYQTRDQQRVFVSYDGLLHEWQQVVLGIGHDLGIVWPVSIEAAASAINAFLDPALRHYANDTKLPDHPACRLALKGFELLSASRPSPAGLDQLRVQVSELTAIISPWSAHSQLVARQNVNLSMLNLEAMALRTELERVKASISWRITKPLRAFWNVLRALLSSGLSNR